MGWMVEPLNNNLGRTVQVGPKEPTPEELRRFRGKVVAREPEAIARAREEYEAGEPAAKQAREASESEAHQARVARLTADAEKVVGLNPYRRTPTQQDRMLFERYRVQEGKYAQDGQPGVDADSYNPHDSRGSA